MGIFEERYRRSKKKLTIQTIDGPEGMLPVRALSKWFTSVLGT